MTLFFTTFEEFFNLELFLRSVILQLFIVECFSTLLLVQFTYGSKVLIWLYLKFDLVHFTIIYLRSLEKVPGQIPSITGGLEANVLSTLFGTKNLQISISIIIEFTNEKLFQLNVIMKGEN